MTREEYLTRLRRNIQALPIDEQTEALEYYLNYFEDAADDDAVMAELGTPEELAETIKEKFACVPAQMYRGGGEDAEDGGEGDSRKRSSNTGRSCRFMAKDVRSLDISVGVAEVVVIAGEDYSVETRGMDEMDLRCILSPYGTLSVDNKRKLPVWNFFGHERSKNWHPRMLVTVPDGAKLDTVKIHVGAGSFVTKDVAFSAGKASFDVGAGNLVVSSVESGRIAVRCGMGNFELGGKVGGFSKIDCAMGSVKLKLSGNIDDYSYDAKVGLGDVKINDQKKSGVGVNESQARKENHFSINCGLGSVEIEIK